MNPRPNRAHLIVAISLFVCLGFLLSNFNGPVSLAQGGQIQVAAADPPLAAQGTLNLNVKVTGKGFKNGAKAKWLVTGTTDPGGVTVNSTTFVNSTELTANITVADTAAIANFDIAVTNADGRGGKGTELFTVIGKQASCGTDVTNLSISIYKFTDATNTTTYNMWPDQTNPDGSPVPYVSGKSKGQSIDGRFQIDNCTYDLTLVLSLSKRYFTWKFPDGSVVGTSANSTGFNIDRVGNVPITDGGTNYLNWCSSATDNYGGCGVDGSGAYLRAELGRTVCEDLPLSARGRRSIGRGGLWLARGGGTSRVQGRCILDAGPGVHHRRARYSGGYQPEQQLCAGPLLCGAFHHLDRGCPDPKQGGRVLGRSGSGQHRRARVRPA